MNDDIDYPIDRVISGPAGRTVSNSLDTVNPAGSRSIWMQGGSFLHIYPFRIYKIVRVQNNDVSRGEESF